MQSSVKSNKHMIMSLPIPWVQYAPYNHGNILKFKYTIMTWTLTYNNYLNSFLFSLFDLILYVPVNNCSVMSGWVVLD